MPRKKKSDATESDQSSDEVPIENAMEELTGIVTVLESGGETLDESLRLYERGMKLMRICHQRLDAAAQRIELITRLDENGTVETTPFDGTATGTKKEQDRQRTGGGGDLFD